MDAEPQSTTLSATLRALADQAEAMEQRCRRQAATITSLQAEAAQSALAREELFQENRRLRALLSPLANAAEVMDAEGATFTDQSTLWEMISNGIREQITLGNARAARAALEGK